MGRDLIKHRRDLRRLLAQVGLIHVFKLSWRFRAAGEHQ
jgi:hypothetical protein